MVPILEAIFAGVCVGIINRCIHHLEHRFWTVPDDDSSSSSMTSAAIEGTHDMDPGGHFWG